MKRMFSESKLCLLLKGLGLVAALTIGVQLLMPLLESPRVQLFIAQNQFAGAVIIIIYIVLSQVAAPVIGSPAVLLGLTLYGPSTTMLLLYLSGLVSSIICFYIARRFCRAWVEKLLGHKAMASIDRITALSGKRLLVVSRVFGYPLFEIVSYAFGLTSMRFREYFIITAAASIIPNRVFAYIYETIPLTPQQEIFIWVGGLLATAAVFGYFLQKYAMRKQFAP